MKSEETKTKKEAIEKVIVDQDKNVEISGEEENAFGSSMSVNPLEGMIAY